MIDLIPIIPIFPSNPLQSSIAIATILTMLHTPHCETGHTLLTTRSWLPSSLLRNPQFLCVVVVWSCGYISRKTNTITRRIIDCLV